MSKKSKGTKQITIDDETEFEDNYCSDCIYDWCTARTKVKFCTMKTKGLFECRSCMLKIIGSFENTLKSITTQEKETISITIEN
ncbi:MAG: hypothetical protein FK734_00920 [Asgard group archaeon]|nr:hypothetical protein [Asgard group archaeon]